MTDIGELAVDDIVHALSKGAMTVAAASDGNPYVSHPTVDEPTSETDYAVALFADPTTATRYLHASGVVRELDDDLVVYGWDKTAVPYLLDTVADADMHAIVGLADNEFVWVDAAEIRDALAAALDITVDWDQTINTPIEPTARLVIDPATDQLRVSQ